MMDFGVYSPVGRNDNLFTAYLNWPFLWLTKFGYMITLTQLHLTLCW